MPVALKAGALSHAACHNAVGLVAPGGSSTCHVPAICPAPCRCRCRCRRYWQTCRHERTMTAKMARTRSNSMRWQHGTFCTVGGLLLESKPMSATTRPCCSGGGSSGGRTARNGAAQRRLALQICHNRSDCAIMHTAAWMAPFPGACGTGYLPPPSAFILDHTPEGRSGNLATRHPSALIPLHPHSPALCGVRPLQPCCAACNLPPPRWRPPSRSRCCCRHSRTMIVSNWRLHPSGAEALEPSAASPPPPLRRHPAAG